MASPKYVKLSRLVKIVNKRNRTSTCTPEHREGWNSLVEQILMDANRYNGFRYLSGDEVPKHHMPGKPDYSNCGPTDDTRIQFNLE